VEQGPEGLQKAIWRGGEIFEDRDEGSREEEFLREQG